MAACPQRILGDDGSSKLVNPINMFQFKSVFHPKSYLCKLWIIVNIFQCLEITIFLFRSTKWFTLKKPILFFESTESQALERKKERKKDWKL